MNAYSNFEEDVSVLEFKRQILNMLAQKGGNHLHSNCCAIISFVESKR